jgi:DNA processing protein
MSQTLDHPEKIARLRLIRTEQIGPVTFWALMTRFGAASRAIDRLPEMARRGGLRRSLAIASATSIEAEFEAAAKQDVRFIFCGEDDYPAMLAAVDPPPPVLAIQSQLQVMTQPCIAIVGARNASGLGRKFARELAADLGAAGYAVVSGLARGIDAAAHEGALRTGTIAVMAGGIDKIYPPENAELASRIKAGGALVSEMPLGLEPVARHFPRRNRLISGLAAGVVVVEAALHSGSLITARLALEQGREVFAVPGSPLDPRARGSNGLLRQGAFLVENVEDVLAAITQHRPERAKAQISASAFPPHISESCEGPDLALQKSLCELLGPAPIEIDELVRQSKAAPEAVSTTLLELELAGRITRHAGQKVSAN